MEGAKQLKFLAIIAGTFLAMALPSQSARAEVVDFSGWTHQKFSLFGGNDWQQSGEELSVVSDGSVSLLWHALSETLWRARSATWTWAVEESVPPTDLASKGGDDRNLSLYFIFAPRQVALAQSGATIRDLLENPDVRVLMYVWGGEEVRDEVVPSPYLGPRGRTIVLQPAGVGRKEERVDLRADLARIFNSSDLALVGLAVSADSDDTSTKIRARIGRLQLEE